MLYCIFYAIIALLIASIADNSANNTVIMKGLTPGGEIVYGREKIKSTTTK